MARTAGLSKEQELESKESTSCVIKLIGNKRVLAEIVALLSDIRHVLKEGGKQVFKVHVNEVINSNPILMTVNNLEIEDYNPNFDTFIN